MHLFQPRVQVLRTICASPFPCLRASVCPFVSVCVRPVCVCLLLSVSARLCLSVTAFVRLCLCPSVCVRPPTTWRSAGCKCWIDVRGGCFHSGASVHTSESAKYLPNNHVHNGRASRNFHVTSGGSPKVAKELSHFFAVAGEFLFIPSELGKGPATAMNHPYLVQPCACRAPPRHMSQCNESYIETYKHKYVKHE